MPIDKFVQEEIDHLKGLGNHWLSKLTSSEAVTAQRGLARLAVIQGSLAAGIVDEAAAQEETKAILNTLGFIKAKTEIDLALAAREFIRGVATRVAAALVAAA